MCCVYRVLNAKNDFGMVYRQEDLDASEEERNVHTKAIRQNGETALGEL